MCIDVMPYSDISVLELVSAMVDCPSTTSVTTVRVTRQNKLQTHIPGTGTVSHAAGAARHFFQVKEPKLELILHFAHVIELSSSWRHYHDGYFPLALLDRGG